MSYPHVITKTIKEFKLISPTTIDEALFALNEYNTDTRIIAGGTDLVPLMKHRVDTPKYVVSIEKIKELDYIRLVGDQLRIGALTKINAIKNSDVIMKNCYSLYEASLVFATSQIRNVATIGGNICRSSPSADTVPSLLVFNAQVKLVNQKRERIIPLEQFFTGPGLNVADAELLTEIIIPIEKGKYGTAFHKISRNTCDLAKVNCAVKVSISNDKLSDVKVAIGAVSDRPIRAKNVEKSLIDKKINAENIEKASEMVINDINPITDVRSTEFYRKEISKVLVKRMLNLAVERATLSN